MTDIIKHGPIFDGRAEIALDEFVRVSEELMAHAAMDQVIERLNSVLQHPTGYYESQIAVEKRFDAYAVTDSGVVYGPWLEGTGSRNKTTRFKGYSTFRIIRDKIRGEAKVQAEVILRPFLRRMQ